MSAWLKRQIFVTTVARTATTRKKDAQLLYIMVIARLALPHRGCKGIILPILDRISNLPLVQKIGAGYNIGLNIMNGMN